MKGGTLQRQCRLVSAAEFTRASADKRTARFPRGKRTTCAGVFSSLQGRERQ